MITENQYLDLNLGDIIIGNDGSTRFRVIYIQNISKPSERRVLFETFELEMFDTMMIDGNILDVDMRKEVPLLNGETAKLLKEKDALIAH